MTGTDTMQAREVLYDTKDRVARITLNRPDKLNPWTAAMQNQLRDMLLRADGDNNVRAIVLTGAGRGFCAGADMAELAVRANRPEPLAASENISTDSLVANFAQRHSYMLALRKPIIAAINGPVAGIGFVLTLFCDIRYMARDAKLTTAFSRRGLIAEQGSAWLLPRLVGPMNALDLLLSGRMIDADEAQAMGFAHALPAEDFAAAVQARAAEIANLTSPRSTAIIKRQVYEGLFQNLAEATVISEREFALCHDTFDFREGIAHFVEKRMPRFAGY